MRRLIPLLALLAILVIGWAAWRDLASRRQSAVASAPTIDKQPDVVTIRTFDPLSPSPDMPPLSVGEEAVCDSRFLSDAKVAGASRQMDSTHATVTITRITMTLQLAVTIWAPPNATQHVIEHENGHRQISEYYYQTADKVAERVAAIYLGKQIEISGADLNAESGKVLQQMAADITSEYNRQLNPDAAQQLYDKITDHSRNESDVNEAVAAAIKNAVIVWITPAAAHHS